MVGHKRTNVRLMRVKMFSLSEQKILAETFCRLNQTTLTLKNSFRSIPETYSTIEKIRIFDLKGPYTDQTKIDIW